jgi:hypothetical protein
MTAIGYEESSVEGDSGVLEVPEFVDKGQRIQNHAIAHDASDLRMKDSRRDDVENVTFTAERNGMPGVVPSLVARNAVESFGEDVDNLSFSFVAPLQADDCDILLHGRE